MAGRRARQVCRPRAAQLPTPKARSRLVQHVLLSEVKRSASARVFAQQAHGGLMHAPPLQPRSRWTHQQLGFAGVHSWLPAVGAHTAPLQHSSALQRDCAANKGTTLTLRAAGCFGVCRVGEVALLGAAVAARLLDIAANAQGERGLCGEGAEQGRAALGLCRQRAATAASHRQANAWPLPPALGAALPPLTATRAAVVRRVVAVLVPARCAGVAAEVAGALLLACSIGGRSITEGELGIGQWVGAASSASPSWVLRAPQHAAQPVQGGAPEPQSHTPGPVELLHVRPVLQSLGVLLPQQTSLKLPLPSWMHWPAQQVLPPEQSESSSHSAQLLR